MKNPDLDLSSVALGAAAAASAAPAAPAVPAVPAFDVGTPAWLRPMAIALHRINRCIVGLGMLALLAASLVLSSSVLSRYFLKASTDWQDEAAVFCLVGATFMCSAFVQSIRGHVGIEAITTILPDRVNRLRHVVVELLCLAFCSFFAWKSWTLLHEAWVDGQTTSSTWAPPLWIPYLLMAVGMSLLCLQLFVQSVAGFNRLMGHTGAR